MLALDIGNSNVKMGVFEGEDLKAVWRFATDPRRMGDEYAVLLYSLLPMKGVQPKDISHVAICSVVPPLTAVFEEMFKNYFGCHPLVVGAGIKTGVRILYDSPRDVGADRVVGAAAAYRLFGGPAIVVEIGTTTVFDAVSKEGDYLGGAIHPGLTLEAESLFTNTSQLRRVEMVRPKEAIGRNTIAAIQSGVILGHVGMVEAMVHRFRRELGESAKAIATGGLAHLVAPETDVFHAICPELVLVGLRLVHELNQ